MSTNSTATGTAGDGKKILFVAHQDDPKGRKALERLSNLGFRTLLLESLQTPEEPFVAVWGFDPDARTQIPIGGKGFYLRTASFRLTNIKNVTPKWADTPLQVAILRTEDRATGNLKEGRTQSTFDGALREMALAFQSWRPGLINWYTPWSSKYPFKADEAFRGSLIADRRGQIDIWLTQAKLTLGHATLSDVLNSQLPEPIFPDAVVPTRPNVIFMGCAPFNELHTDVSTSLVDSKIARVRKFTITLVKNLEMHVGRFVFPLVSGDFMDNDMLKDSLHPFMFRSLNCIESGLNATRTETEPRIIIPRKGVRIKDLNGVRTPEQMKEALRFAADLVQRELIDPVTDQTGVRIVPITWTDLLGPEILDRSWRMAIANNKVVESIYFERVGLHPWWKTIDSFDREAGLLRCYANVGIYLAVAMLLAKYPNTIVLDFEVDKQYWVRLRDLITREIWHGSEFLIFPTPDNTLQPWGY